MTQKDKYSDFLSSLVGSRFYVEPQDQVYILICVNVHTHTYMYMKYEIQNNMKAYGRLGKGMGLVERRQGRKEGL